MIYLKLFQSFVMIGLASYGGGLVTVGLVIHEVVTARNWLSVREMTDVITLSQLTPGPIAINSATYTGFRLLGLGGAAVATVSVLTAPLLIMTIILLVKKVVENKSLSREGKIPLLSALRPGILALLLQAVVQFGRSALDSTASVLLCITAFALFWFVRRLHPFWVMLGAGLIGMVVF
jgi:chromate transporter